MPPATGETHFSLKHECLSNFFTRHCDFRKGVWNCPVVKHDRSRHADLKIKAHLTITNTQLTRIVCCKHCCLKKQAGSFEHRPTWRVVPIATLVFQLRLFNNSPWPCTPTTQLPA
eukprot:1159912-Pelagomonas_calceolata.AAC.4